VSQEASRDADRRFWIFCAALAALSLVVYANALANGFALDDIGAIVENVTIRSWSGLGRIFQSNYWATGQAGAPLTDPGLYRPLTVLTYLVDYQLWGLHAAPYHAENVLLHCAVTLLVFLVGRRVLRADLPALAAAALFAVHPIHTDAVTSVVGRAELLAALFFLLAFIVARRARATGITALSVGMTALLYFLGLLSKESAITLPVVLLLDDWLNRDEFGTRNRGREAVLRYGALAIVLAAYLALRAQAVAGHGSWLGFDGVSAGARMLTASRVLLEYIGLFLFTRVLLADYWTSDVPIAHSVAEPVVLLSVAAWIVLGVLIATKLRRDRGFILSSAWYFITILPASNLIFAAGIGKAERIVYLPSVGLCILAGWVLLVAARRMEIKRLVPAFAVVVVLFGARTIRRNADWKDNATLAAATLEHSPNSPIMNDIAAKAYADRGEYARAVELYRRSIQQAPNVALAHSHLAALYMQRGTLDSAIAEYRSGLKLDPNNPEMRSNLGLAYLRAGFPEEAIAELRNAARLAASSPQPHVNLGVVYSERGALDDAIAEFSRAILLDPNLAEAHIDLGVAYLKKGNVEGAISELVAGTRLEPNSPQAHNNLGFAFLQRGDKPQAAEHFRMALQLRPDYANARANLQKALQP
jgi:Flp pilus assembly protein TadD